MSYKRTNYRISRMSTAARRAALDKLAVPISVPNITQPAELTKQEEPLKSREDLEILPASAQLPDFIQEIPEHKPLATPKATPKVVPLVLPLIEPIVIPIVKPVPPVASLITVQESDTPKPKVPEAPKLLVPVSHAPRNDKDMADTTVVPNSDKVVVVDDSHGRGHDRPSWSNDWARDAERVMSAVLPAIQNAEGRIQNSAHNTEGRLQQSVNDSSARIEGNIHNFEGREADRFQNFEGRTGDRFQNLEAREADRFTNFEAREADRFSDIKDKVWHGTEKLVEKYGYISKQIADSERYMVSGFKDAQGLAYQVEGRSLLEATKNTNLLSVQATANFNALMVETVKNAAASELTARTIAATAAAQLAECCCEMKLMQKDTLAAIKADGDETRALIQSNTIQDLRDRLAATQRLIPITVGVPL